MRIIDMLISAGDRTPISSTCNPKPSTCYGTIRRTAIDDDDVLFYRGGGGLRASDGRTQLDLFRPTFISR